MVDVLGASEQVYLSDEDPDLVGSALPFNLKTLETLLQSSPENRRLLLSATKAFVLYGYGFVEPLAWELSPSEFDAAETIRKRAAGLYRRGFDYGMRGLQVDHAGLGERLKVSPEQAAQELDLEDLPLTVWSGAALGAAISVSKDDPESTADIAVVGALLERALALDEDYDHGAIHEFLLTYEASRIGGSREKAREHYERALVLGPAKAPSIWLSWAERVSVAEQNRAEFLDLLQKTLAFDVSAHPETRLVNLLAQRRARWLESEVDELFLEGN